MCTKTETETYEGCNELGYKLLNIRPRALRLEVVISQLRECGADIDPVLIRNNPGLEFINPRWLRDGLYHRVAEALEKLTGIRSAGWANIAGHPMSLYMRKMFEGYWANR